jgi:hypothetical protein
MRFMTSILMAFSILALVGCAQLSDDGYLSPPGYGDFDLRAASARAPRELLGATYLVVTRDQDCLEACDVFDRGFERARTLRLTSPTRCTDEFENGLWSQNEYQEGCIAYALKVIDLVDRCTVERRLIVQG